MHSIPGLFLQDLIPLGLKVGFPLAMPSTHLGQHALPDRFLLHLITMELRSGSSADYAVVTHIGYPPAETKSFSNLFLQFLISMELNEDSFQEDVIVVILGKPPTQTNFFSGSFLQFLISMELYEDHPPHAMPSYMPDKTNSGLFLQDLIAVELKEDHPPQGKLP